MTLPTMHSLLHRQQRSSLIYVEDVWEIVYAESNSHVTDDVTRPYDVIVVTMQHAYYVAYSGLSL